MPSLPIQKQVALLTKHNKQQAIEPILRQAFSTELVTTDHFDTDTLGSFDGSVTRTLSPDKSALKKAYLACELTGLSQGLGSEGSFNSHFLGAIVDEEVIAFVDTHHKIEIIACAQKMIDLSLITANDETELNEKLRPYKQGLHRYQKWMLKAGKKWEKGLEIGELVESVSAWPCTFEPDFRAMNCPVRQNVIAEATKDLVRRLNSHCEECNSPNFVEKPPKNGLAYLSCELCGGPTTQLKALPTCCDFCGNEVADENAKSTASAFYCTLCNP